MRVISIDVPTGTAKNVIELARISQSTWSGVFFQAPEQNKDVVLFGDRSNQLFELRPEKSAFFPITELTSLFVVAPDTGNKLTLGLL